MERIARTEDTPSVDQLLAPSPNISLPEYKVPAHFVADFDVVVLIEKGKEEGREEVMDALKHIIW